MLNHYIELIASFIDSVGKDGICSCQLEFFTRCITCNFNRDVCVFKNPISLDQRDQLVLFLLSKPKIFEHVNIKKDVKEDYILHLCWKPHEEYLVRKKLKHMLNDTTISLDVVHDTLIDYLK